MHERRARRIASRASNHVNAIGAIVGAFLLSATVLAQTPDFSGEWRLDSSRMYGGMTGFGLATESPAERLVIRQNREVLDVEERENFGVSHMKYGLVAQTIIQPADGRIAPEITRTTSRWEGTKLMTEIGVGGASCALLLDGCRLEQVRFLRPDGAMVVEMRMTDRGRSRLAWTALYTRAIR